MSKTMAEFIASAGLTMTCKPIANNPNMIDPDSRMSHWACKIKAGRSQLTVAFSMGAAHTGEPKLADVLSCLASDASGVENSPKFEDWCAEYGYDTDSRKAERTFKVCQQQANNLMRLLGHSAYEALLYSTEQE